jgi:putative FmdB family regulatory protein
MPISTSYAGPFIPAATASARRLDGIRSRIASLALREPECQPEGEWSVPTYQYRCTDCGEPLEVVQSFTDDPLTVCPACEGQLRKVFSSVGVVFKGSGFYRTDSRAEAKAAKSKSESKTDTKTDTMAGAGSESSKTETKPDKSSDKPADKPAASTPSKSDSSTSKSSAA